MFVSNDGAQANLNIVIRDMISSLSARGPDSSGVWYSECLALGHSRLAVQDLSDSGHQPMLSRCGRYVIVFNGEIYNHLALRLELEKEVEDIFWRGKSDTETLLLGLTTWGVEGCLKKLSGMFAFAFWDSVERSLVIARDRLGEKPLYYGWAGGNFLFGSELKALQKYPRFNNAVSRIALSQYLRFTYVPAPYSIWEDIYKLEPGCVLYIRGSPPSFGPYGPIHPNGEFKTLVVRRYWALKDVVSEAEFHPIKTESQAKVELRRALDVAVGEQMISDVSLGAFLSGGIDSSLIVSTMQGLSRAPVSTFTIGFEDPRFDESDHARAVAKHLGTNHTEIKVTERDALNIIPKLPFIYDEPFSDSSQIPSYLVSKLAKESVTVALSGDGGDELFCGYNKYYWNDRIWKYFSPFPFMLRKIAGKGIKNIEPATWDRISKRFGRDIRLGDKINKMADRLISVENQYQLYLSLVSEWDKPETCVIGNISTEDSLPTFFREKVPNLAEQDLSLKMMYWDTV